MRRSYVRRRRRRKARKKGKVYKRGIPRKALSGRIDTAIEKRMQVIARKEAQANIVKLIDRNFYFGSCDHTTNHWRDLSLRLKFDGIVQEILKIDKLDINQVLNAPDIDMSEPPEQKEQDADGSNQGMTTATHHGKRLGDTIKVTGLSLAMKLFADRTPDEYSHMTAYNANNNPDYVGESAYHQWFTRQANGEYDRYLPETVTVDYGFYQVWDESAPANPTIRPTPSVDQLLTKRPWGYSAALDDFSNQQSAWTKKKCLMKGSLSYQLRASVNRDKTIKRFVRFKTPKTVKFLPEDQNGEQKMTSRFFFCARSNIPQTTGTQVLDYSPFAPRVALCIKSHYIDV